MNIPSSRLLELQMFSPVEVSASNCLRFGSNAELSFDVQLSFNDKECMKRAMADAHEIANRIGRFRRGCEPRWLDMDPAHIMGTCRMADGTGKDCVTDEYGCVDGFDNLYLAGVGLIPKSIASNPTLTGVALGIRTAAKIVSLGM